ncbi:N-acetyltransferase [Paenibacillus anaericanus]|uniref:N-acetyltransferase n=1 Tax=Paenibacillus anaericanus TaxID=170367 RepID=A0A433Y618_9BACL|nr:GNAT family protein [Paenibacillus anaericanus]RUT44462.1 N-acetyltransferase [Paenibacillus anaericanus]
MIIETDRLFISDFKEEDWSKVHSYCSDEEVTKYTLWGPNSEDQTRDYINSSILAQYIKPREKHELAITIKTTNELIGNCCLNIEGSNAEIGYCFSKEYWGDGFATEVANGLLKFGFNQMGLHRIYATCRPQNTSSARVMEKIGMKKEGHLREHVRSKNNWQDSFVYSILIQEFESILNNNKTTSGIIL